MTRLSRNSDLVEIVKQNGDFQRNYGKLLGAFLYLRSLRAARGRLAIWMGLIFGLVAAALPRIIGLRGCGLD